MCVPEPISLRCTTCWWRVRSVIASATAVTALLGSVVQGGPAVGVESSNSKQRQVAQLEQQLEALDDQMSALAEDANEANERLRRAERSSQDASVNEAESVAAHRAAVSRARSEATRRYVDGPRSGFKLSADLQTNAVRRVYRDLATGQNIDHIDELAAATQDQQRAKQRADRARRAVATEKAAIERAMKRLDKLASDQESLLARTRSDVAVLLVQEEKRRQQAEIATAKREEAQRKATARKLLEQRRAEQEREAARRRSQTPSLRTSTSTLPRSRNTGGTGGTGGAGPADQADSSDAALSAAADEQPASPPARGASIAVDTALAQLGKPYVWGGSGEKTFDCSGLMGFAWARAGKTLPHSSRAQYAVTRRVSRSDLQPGDLLFFGRPIHHVGMYIGNGQMVEAPHRRAKVRVRSAWRKDFVGAGRVK